MNIYLIGYRGCGKSSVARALAERVDWHTLDSDKIVEADAGKTIKEIFEQQGEPAFRKLEQQTIADIGQKERIVVSLGGGAIMAEANQQVVAATGKAVYLAASPEVLWSRINGDPTTTTQRPDFTEHGGLAEVRSVLERRAATYEACADCRIDTQDLTVEEVADQIFEWWQTVDN